MTSSPHHGISALGLRHHYGELCVLDGVDLEVAPGEVVALLGPNGAGKTTTLRLLTTTLPLREGRASVGGFDVAATPQQVRSVIAATGQSAAIDPLLTGVENLRMIARLRGLPRREVGAAVDAALAAAGLGDAAGRRAGSYSGGMRRKLDLALGLVAPARVLFLDEPTTGLDTRARAALWDQVRSAAAGGAAVLVTTQYLEEADQLADRVVIIHGGRVVANDSPAALKASVASPRLEVSTASGTITRHTDATAEDVRALLAGIPDDAAVTLRHPTLDDVFLDLTQEVSA